MRAISQQSTQQWVRRSIVPQQKTLRVSSFPGAPVNCLRAQSDL